MSNQAEWWLDTDIAAVDWIAAKALLTADCFDNGRSPAALRKSFENSTHVVFAWAPAGLVGMARMLSDGVCNAYVVDVWTRSSMRRQGIAAGMLRHLQQAVPGQHIGLQTDDATAFYVSLGYRRQPEFMSLVVGAWLDNAANR